MGKKKEKGSFSLKTTISMKVISRKGSNMVMENGSLWLHMSNTKDFSKKMLKKG